MKTKQTMTQIQTLAKKGLLLTAVTTLSLASFATFNNALAHALCIKLPGIQLGCDGDGGGETTPGEKPSPEVQYTVIQKDPHTQSIVRRFGPVTKARATQKQRQFQRTHYAIFRYAGIGEQIQTKRFSSRTAAQNYLASKGPCRDANVFGICVLDLQQVRPAIVEIARVN